MVKLVGSAGAILAILLTTACGSAHKSPVGKVKVRIALGNNGQDVSNGGVSGRGHFTATGAIADSGTATTYRTVKGVLPGGIVTLRIVMVGKKGNIAYRVKIDTSTGRSRWSIISATKAYKGVQAAGTERDDAEHTTSTLTGTVSDD